MLANVTGGREEVAAEEGGSAGLEEEVLHAPSSRAAHQLMDKGGQIRFNSVMSGAVRNAAGAIIRVDDRH